MGKIDLLESDMRIAATILEWEMGDIWGHVGVRVPEEQTIAVNLFRTSVTAYAWRTLFCPPC